MFQIPSPPNPDAVKAELIGMARLIYDIEELEERIAPDSGETVLPL